MDLIDHPVFWAAHLWSVTRGPLASGDSDTFDMIFGLSNDAIDAFYFRELRNELDWPYFHIPLHSGYAVEIEYANDPEDHQLLYRICHNEWPSSICIGIGGGHWHLPAFRWAELHAISRVAVRSASTLLLLLPAMWLTSDDDVDEVRQRLFDECENTIKLPYAKIDFLVEQLIISIQSNVRWRRQEQLGWVNDGKNSTRNPESPASLNIQEFSSLLTFFNSMAT